MDHDMDQISIIMANALGRLIQDDFGLPIHVFSISSNGSILVCQYVKSLAHAGLETEILYERYCDDAFVIPINIMFVGANGEAARLIIEKPGGEGKFQYLN